MATIPMGDGMHAEARQYQAIADSRLRALGHASGCPPILEGEGLLEYKQRTLKLLQGNSPEWKSVNMGAVRDAAVLQLAEKQILAAAEREARAPSNIPRGKLVERVSTDAAGRQISRFFGDPECVWGPFKSPYRNLIGIGRAR